MVRKIPRQKAITLSAFFFSSIALATNGDPAPTNQARTQVVINPAAAGNPASSATQIIVPTPMANPNLSQSATPLPTPGAASPSPGAGSSAPAIPAQITSPVSYGRFRNKDGTTKVADLMLERFKESVVKIYVRDNVGNLLSHAMGVAVGKNPTYIAAPLSLILGNALQWGDKLDIQHYAGNGYSAKLILVDEQLDLALLEPENMPQPVPLAREDDVRAGISVHTIGLASVVAQPGQDPAAVESRLEPKIFKGSLAAINPDLGSLSVSKEVMNNDFSGTGVINMQGELVGMLLPNGKGVLASALASAMERAKKASSFPLRMLGAVMGRGVLVDPQLTGAYKTIGEALTAIKKGEAPRSNPKLYTPAKSRDLAPREADQVILKVVPGIYKEKETLTLPEKISLSGSGPKETILSVASPNVPVIKIENAKGVSVTGFRIVPAALQPSAVATVLINRSDGAVLLGNIIEARGGSAVEVQRSLNIGVFGNSFPRGKNRAVFCRESQMQVEANSFLGDWPQAVSVDNNCFIKLTRSLFLETTLGVALSSRARLAEVRQNTFLRAVSGLRFFGTPANAIIEDNIFSGGLYSITAVTEIDAKKIGRNQAWKSLAQAKGKTINTLDMVKAEPIFENPSTYDFRLKVRNAVVGSGSLRDSEGERSDLGAYQRTDFLGKYTSYFIKTLEVATSQEELGAQWGFQ